MKKFKKASEILEKIDLNNFNLIDKDVVYENQGLCYFEMGNYLEATRLFLKSLNQNPNNFYSKYNLTMIYLIKKDYESAEKGLVELLETEPDNEILKKNLNLIREELNK